MEQLLRNEGYVPYGDESEIDELNVTPKNYTIDQIYEDRTIWIEKNANFSASDDHRVTIHGRRLEIQGAGQQVFLVIQVVVGFLLPLVIIVVSYYCVISGIQKAQKRLRQASEVESQLTRRVMIFVGAFFVCWAPFYLLRILYNFGPDELFDECRGGVTYFEY